MTAPAVMRGSAHGGGLSSELHRPRTLIARPHYLTHTAQRPSKHLHIMIRPARLLLLCHRQSASAWQSEPLETFPYLYTLHAMQHAAIGGGEVDQGRDR
jgi:hypothetical protein